MIDGIYGFIGPVMIFLLIVGLVVGIIYLVRNSKKSDLDESRTTGPAPGPAPGPTPGPESGPTLVITESGSTTETYRIRENYTIMPDVSICHQGRDNNWCEPMGYNKDIHGAAFIYDMSLPKNVSKYKPCTGDICVEELTECPNGGYDCAFLERYDENGALVSISDKDGNELLEKMADDVWNGRWEDWDESRSFDERLEYVDGKLLLKSDSFFGSKGDEFTLAKANDLGMPIAYFIALLIFKYRAGEPKPGSIVLNVTGAREKLLNRIAPQISYV